MDGSYDDKPWLKYYAAGVPEEIDVPHVALTALLDDAVARFPRRTALAFFGRTISYRRLGAAVDHFAAALRGLGVVKGDRVGIVLPNCPQQVIAFYGALRLGAIVVQCNPLYTASELHHQLVDSGAKVVIVFDRAYATLAEACEGTRVEHIVVTSLVEYLPKRKQVALRLPLERAREARDELVTELPPDADVVTFQELLTADTERLRPVAIDPAEDLALLQYTGGTTGRPKGAMLTHRNLVANAYQTRAWDPQIRDGREVTIAVLPLFHAFGLTFCLTTTVLAAGTIVLLPRFDVDHVFEAIDKHKPTIFPGVPPIYSQLVSRTDVHKHKLASIRTCVSGAMSLPRETVRKFQAVTGGSLVQGYGLTETSPVALANPLDGNARHVSVGLPVPSTEARIVNEANPEEVMPVGTAGELLIRGPQVFAGYWNQMREGAQVRSGGWVRTGDIAFMSPDGFFTLIDRKRDVIMVSGFSVFPSEIEEIIREHRSIEDCAVIGVPDSRRGEAVTACVVVREGSELTEDGLRAHCAERLVNYKVPTRVEFRDDLPRNMLGKVLRRVLRDEHGAHSLSYLGASDR